jgi:hypothetical protein
MNRSLAIPFVLALPLLALATGARAGDAGAAKPAAVPDAAATPDAPVRANIDWASMTVEQKKKYMKVTVLPTMKKEFQAFDVKAYKKFTCETCHGDGVETGKFKMPNPKLPRLPQPTSRSDFVELQKKKPEYVKFMGTVVKPKMAALLGLPEWSPDNIKGFGCYRCHGKVGE